MSLYLNVDTQSSIMMYIIIFFIAVAVGFLIIAFIKLSQNRTCKRKGFAKSFDKERIRRAKPSIDLSNYNTKENSVDGEDALKEFKRMG